MANYCNKRWKKRSKAEISSFLNLLPEMLKCLIKIQPLIIASKMGVILGLVLLMSKLVTAQGVDKKEAKAAEPSLSKRLPEMWIVVNVWYKLRDLRNTLNRLTRPLGPTPVSERIKWVKLTLAATSQWRVMKAIPLSLTSHATTWMSRRHFLGEPK